jgi:hypothetical protein
VPFFVQGDAPAWVPTGAGQLPVYLSQPGEPVRGNGSGQLEGKALERGEYGPGFLHLSLVEGPDREAPAHVGLENPFSSEPKQGLADGSPANPKVCGYLGVPHPAAGREVTAVDPVEDLAINLVAERRSGYDESLR